MQDQGLWTRQPKKKVTRDNTELPAELQQLVNLDSYMDGGCKLTEDDLKEEENEGNKVRERQREIKAAHKQEVAAKAVEFSK